LALLCGSQWLMTSNDVSRATDPQATHNHNAARRRIVAPADLVHHCDRSYYPIFLRLTMGQLVSLPLRLSKTTATYWSGLYHYLAGSGRNSPYSLAFSSEREVGPTTTTTSTTTRSSTTSSSSPSSSSPSTTTLSFAPLRPLPTDTAERRQFKQHARIHLYSLAANFYLYHLPHYRKASYREDLVDNLRNVAIPGTGLALSWVARNRWVAGAFLAVGYPAVSLVAALHKCVRSRFAASVADEYEARLLAPDDWFR
jgi:hypothetical protein